jgi:deoxyribonuclease V
MNALEGEWPSSPEQLVEAQERLAAARPEIWHPGDRARSAAGCFVCFPRGLKGKGAAGDRAWAAAASWIDGRLAAVEVVRASAPAPYVPGLLALREGPLLEAAVRRLPALPEVLLVDATGFDHPRRAGLALHLGARLDVPTVGVTERPLDAEGVWPDEPRGSASPLRIGHEVVGYWLRVKARSRPLAVHAAWRTDPATAVAVVMALAGCWRTPEPLRHARRAARAARAVDEAAPTRASS